MLYREEASRQRGVRTQNLLPSGSARTVFFLVLFALACRCVVGPRVEIGLPKWLEIVLTKLGLKSTWTTIKRRGESQSGRHARSALDTSGRKL